MLKASKRMLTEHQVIPTVNKYRTILVGDPYCGKSSYIQLLARKEKESGAPILISDDQNEFEFSVRSSTTNRAIFIVYDTANQEKFRSLTQSYYRRVECALLLFNKHNEDSLLNLNKWYCDIMNYSKNREKNFSIVIVCLITNDANDLNEESKVKISSIVENFQKEKEFVIGSCEIDLNKPNNLKEPFEIIHEHIQDSKFLISESQLIYNSNFYIKLEKNSKSKKCC
ncbi:ras and EF-hand domain-containing -like isoform X2 [Brachionus plicatilis]|uniref:Ras and EF-hand domain-containing-like isoform X2 n=1 Tax=Brachionus plicatilis TaxID=10195 RepID=A0A3M7T2A9_BRAPC|nr:ras and EF-hand domain-containing -like isoform X2 [Brachionus plicatilis]